jgi:hypothetical protein
VKWWLLALPQYLITALFVGGGIWLVGNTGNGDFNWAAGGLVGVLVLVAGIVLLVTGRYPRPIFDFVLGMDRWVLRVAAYASLMTDEYPPFRLDMGGVDPAGPAEPPATRPDPGQSGWTSGRTAAAVVGAVLVLTSMGLLTGGSALLWADRTQRDADGFFSGSDRFVGSGYALTSDPIQLHGVETGWSQPSSVIGDARIQATSEDPLKPVFVGIAPAGAAARYLAGVEYTIVNDFADSRVGSTTHPGVPMITPPGDSDIWVAQASGRGPQTLTWPVLNGQWTVVVMNADASPGIAAWVSAGATVPVLGWITAGLLACGVFLLAGGVALIWGAAHRASRPPAGPPSAPFTPPVDKPQGTSRG